ncbi:hypothetical protein BFP72_04450 [Reichenbachiella sp. 5M10]|uniref:lipocalin family protein n=1 Tax=Reichenbachiella sp. 5M10 TaxID=1889772 RepID=UPI000C46A757|nr:lipocalin family protein [Reichenbachiella sp. 5M10]PIB34711.1 hypothetical protein BFP72_04450 [Reichenbachiella sp. 5M10]
MKLAIIYMAVASAMVGLITVMLTSGEHPHDHLVGTWKETAWHYEKLDVEEDHEGSISLEIDHQMKREISEQMVIHKAEVWHFRSNGEIGLYDESGNGKKLDWRLKGRGNILKLVDENNSFEHYSIKSLSENRMEIHFSTDIGARGVVKMIFEKLPNTITYAEEI